MWLFLPCIKVNIFYGVDANGCLNDPNLPEDMRPFSYVLTLEPMAEQLKDRNHRSMIILVEQIVEQK